MLDFIRIACAVPTVKVGDVNKNTEDMIRFMADADTKGADLVLFPELALTGYSCGDLFFQDALHSAVKDGVARLAEATANYPTLTAVVGLPLRLQGRLLNCAAVLRCGRVCGIVPKSYIPDYCEFNEKRWFDSGLDLEETELDPRALGLPAEHGPVWLGAEQIFDLGGGAMLGVEICEDAFAPIPPSAGLALCGANVIVNLSASPEAAGKRAKRQNLVKSLSVMGRCIYAYCSAACSESTTDVVFSGHSIIAEDGTILQENEKQLDGGYMLIRDCDLGKIRTQRCRDTTFRDAAKRYCGADYPTVKVGEELRSDGSLYPLRKLPFVPSAAPERRERCLEIFNTQVTGLQQRLATIGSNAVIGISGGLDSTLALLVAVEAMRRLGRPASDVYGVTMPCFGTSDRTYQNAWELMRKLGVTAKEIDIKAAVTQHFADIGHDVSVHNGTYENSQARERTQILMDYASVVGGIVIGTGDLSELALGWCTFNGDHMSMYGVNGGVPKTLIRWIIETVSKDPEFACAQAVLADILDTPISPELLPPDAEGKISQQTEDLVGPYALHDFFLYYMLHHGFGPEKIYRIACRAFAGDFDAATIKKWLVTFYRRFFTQQFKRNCQPDGVKVGSVGLAPRGDWQMPSDASGRIWLEEAEAL